MGTIFIVTYLASLFIITMIQSPVVVTISGFNGEVHTDVFVVKENSWDIKVTYFKSWSFAWNLRIELFEEENDQAVFSTSVARYIYPNATEGFDLRTHPSLPPGRYYLKVTSVNVQWTVQVVEWKS